MNSIYDILNKLNSIQPEVEASAVEQTKPKSKLQESINSLSEKWAGDAEVKSTGQYADKTVAELKSMLAKLHKSGPHERGSAADKKMKQINFALRAKGGWKKGEGAAMKEEDVAEVAPPGAKAERMIKHIKKGYAKDGKLTPKEKSIAYATAWKAHKAGKVEEAVASLKPLLAAGMTAEQISEGWEDMMKAVKKQHKDEVGTGKFDKKNVSTGTVYTRKYDADGMSNTDDEVKADGEKRGRGRPKKNTFESSIDRLMAEAYGDHAYRPSGEDIAGPEKKTIGDKIKGLGRDLMNKIAPDDETLLKDLEKKTIGEEEGEELSYEQDQLRQAIGDDMFAQVRSATEQGAGITDDMYDALYDYYTESGEMPYGTAKARDGDPMEWIEERVGELFGDMTESETMNNELEEMMKLAGMQVEEDDVEEGNEFSGALAKAKASGAKEFEVDGKKYPVKEDEEQIDECGPMPTEMPMGELTISGSPEALAAMLKLAGLQAPAMMEQPVEEEKDPRY